MTANNIDAAALFTPFNTDVVKTSLEKGAEAAIPLSQKSLSLIEFFHKNNPEVLRAFAEAEENTDAADAYYRSAMNLDPNNPEVKRQYLKFLTNGNRYREAFDLLWLYAKAWLEDDARITALYVDGAIDAGNKTDLLSIFASQWEGLLFAKAYYIMGFTILSVNPQVANQYWEIAQYLAPTWNYFYVEQAAASLYVFGDEKAAKTCLQECLQHVSNDPFCGAALDDLRQLPYPGEQKRNIVSL
jgi:tetratricopeptide (TPR) repeat protein